MPDLTTPLAPTAAVTDDKIVVSGCSCCTDFVDDFIGPPHLANAPHTTAAYEARLNQEPPPEPVETTSGCVVDSTGKLIHSPA